MKRHILSIRSTSRKVANSVCEELALALQIKTGKQPLTYPENTFIYEYADLGYIWLVSSDALHFYLAQAAMAKPDRYLLVDDSLHDHRSKLTKAQVKSLVEDMIKSPAIFDWLIADLAGATSGDHRLDLTQESMPEDSSGLIIMPDAYGLVDDYVKSNTGMMTRNLISELEGVNDINEVLPIASAALTEVFG